MKLEIFNSELIDTSLVDYLPKIEKEFSQEIISSVNIIFVTSEFIKELNNQYRGVNNVTDVLSFNIDTEELLGEIYICPEYIKTTHPELPFKEEILRLIIHGLLHLTGYDHTVELTEETKKTEPMFVKQEKMLDNVL